MPLDQRIGPETVIYGHFYSCVLISENYDAPMQSGGRFNERTKGEKKKNDNKTVANMTNQIDLHHLKCKLSSARHSSSVQQQFAKKKR